MINFPFFTKVLYIPGIFGFFKFHLSFGWFGDIVGRRVDWFTLGWTFCATWLPWGKTHRGMWRWFNAGELGSYWQRSCYHNFPESISAHTWHTDCHTSNLRTTYHLSTAPKESAESLGSLLIFDSAPWLVGWSVTLDPSLDFRKVSNHTNHGSEWRERWNHGTTKCRPQGWNSKICATEIS